MNKLNQFRKITLLSLAVACIMFFIAIINLFDTTLLTKLIIIEILLIFYVVMLKLIPKIFSQSQPEIKIIEKEVPFEVIKEVPVVKIKTVKVKEKAPKIHKAKFYGSTQASTYHRGTCRFSGMIKKEFLITKNTNDYFKKEKFHACQNCKPNRK
ncbi:hypothetical protein HOD29_05555 [archaeon]|jgi:hypothetical protein|nr:hypothetical protein [archaeon]